MQVVSLVRDDWIGSQELSLKLPTLILYARVCFALGSCEYANLNTADVICLFFGQGSFFDGDIYVEIALCIDAQDKYMWFNTFMLFLLKWPAAKPLLLICLT